MSNTVMFSGLQAFGQENRMYLMGIAAVIAVIGIVRAIMISRGESVDSKEMTKDLAEFPVQLGSVGPVELEKYNLRDFYIASSLNSCCSKGGQMYTYASTDALKNVIKQGARALDFEIFTVDGKPVISASTSSNSNYVKATLNSVPFDEAMLTVRNYCFSSGFVQNYRDPVIINLRMSTGIDVYDSMAKSIKSAFCGSDQRDNCKHLLHKKHKHDADGYNIGAMKMSELQGKVIIFCTGSESIYRNKPDFYDLVSGSASSVFLRQLSHYDVLYGAGNDPDLINYNKKNMSAVIAAPGEDTTIAASTPLYYGCQMVFMDYSNTDNNLAFLLSKFNKAGTAFILRPKSQRYIPIVVRPPTPQNPELSYKPATMSKPYFTANI